MDACVGEVSVLGDCMLVCKGSECVEGVSVGVCVSGECKQVWWEVSLCLYC